MNLSLQWLISFRRMPEDSHSRIQAQESLFRRLERFHGISAALASERLHALKEHFGRRADENVLFDLTGNVYDPNNSRMARELNSRRCEMTTSHVGEPEPAAKVASRPDVVYAIVRLDEYLGDDVPLERKVTVKKIVREADEAEQEVERLNGLQKDGGVRYFAQITRLEKEQGAAETPADDGRPR